MGASQEKWLEGELGPAAAEHLFLLSHYLPAVSGIRTYLKLADERESTHLMKLSVTNQVTAWLGGHYHSFVVGDIDGVKYVVAGGGGGERDGPRPELFSSYRSSWQETKSLTSFVWCSEIPFQRERR